MPPKRRHAAIVSLLSTLVAVACGGGAPAPQTVPIYSDMDASVEAAPLTPPPHDIGCTIRYDREEMNHMVALDECLGASRRECWSGCEAACNSCGLACARDPTCEARCIAERDTCKSNHCVDIHAQCRTDLVRDWLSNRCDALCAPFRACVQDCSQHPSRGCLSKCEATATASCNPNRCDALQSAPERKTLDPRWRRNDCDRVCSRVWKCADARCSKTSGCGEPIKMFLPCVARVPRAKACGLAESQGLCPEH
jgi:hypothetical protein